MGEDHIIISQLDVAALAPPSMDKKCVKIMSKWVNNLSREEIQRMSEHNVYGNAESSELESNLRAKFNDLLDQMNECGSNCCETLNLLLKSLKVSGDCLKCLCVDTPVNCCKFMRAECACNSVSDVLQCFLCFFSCGLNALCS